MKVGIHEQYQGPKATTVASTTESFPLIEVTREFEADVIQPQDLVRRLILRCKPLWEAGKATAWSFKPDPAAVDSGRWKPFILELAQYIKDNNLQDKVIVVIWHEPENDVPKFFRSAADFVRLFNTVHDWLMSVDPSIVTSHAALGYWYRNVSANAAKAWVTKCTIHSIDIYSGRSFPLAMTLKTSKPFQIWKASRPAGSKWGVSERGWIAAPADSAARAASIDAESDYLASLAPAERPEFYIVWNTEGTEADPKIVLDQAGKDAVNRLFARLTRLICPLCAGTGYVPPGQTYTVVRTG